MSESDDATDRWLGIVPAWINCDHRLDWVPRGKPDRKVGADLICCRCKRSFGFYDGSLTRRGGAGKL